MQPERFVTCGLVLRETVTRDADKILTVLTPDRGRLSVMRPYAFVCAHGRISSRSQSKGSPSSPGAPGAREAAWPRPASCWPIRR